MQSVVYVAMLMLLIFYLYGCIGFIVFREEDPAHFDTIIEAFVFTLFRACTLEDWTDLFYTSYFGCESYGYVAFKDVLQMTERLYFRLRLHAAVRKVKDHVGAAVRESLRGLPQPTPAATPHDVAPDGK